MQNARHFMSVPPAAASAHTSGLGALRNLGPASTRLLAEVGIHSRDDLVRAGGALGACERLFAAGRSPSLVLAYALEGALLDCDWRALPHAFRAELVRGHRLLRTRHPRRP
jgi:hypothetical protein